MLIVRADLPKFLLRYVSNSLKRPSWLYLAGSAKQLSIIQKVFHSGVDLCSENVHLDKISRRDRAAFIAWIDKIPKDNCNDGAWCFAGAALKNPFVTPLYLKYCFQTLVTESFQNNPSVPDVVFVDSRAVEECLRERWPGRIGSHWLNTYLELFQSAYRVYRVGLNLVSAVARTSSLVIHSRALQNVEKTLMLSGCTKIVLVRNYLVREFSDDNYMFWEHQLPGLDQYLEEHGFVPVFLSIPTQVVNPGRLVAQIKRAKATVLIAEQFLSVTQILGAAVRTFRFQIFGSGIDQGQYGLELKRLLSESIKSPTVTDPLFKGLLYCGVAGGMAKKGIQPLSIINWAENQAAEKGVIFGFRRLFPRLKVTSVQPFIAPPNLLSIYPSKQDRVYGVEPDRLLVLGDAARRLAARFDRNLEIGFCPPFRYQYRSQPLADADANTVMVLLGYDLDNSIYTLKTISAAWGVIGKDYTLKIRTHPAATFTFDELCIQVFGGIPEYASESSDELNKELSTTVWAICGSTGATVELALKGVPTVLISDPHFLPLNYLEHMEGLAAEPWWSLCWSVNDLIAAAKNFESSPRRLCETSEPMIDCLGQKIFAPSSESHWRALLPTPE